MPQCKCSLSHIPSPFHTRWAHSQNHFALMGYYRSLIGKHSVFVFAPQTVFFQNHICDTYWNIYNSEFVNYSFFFLVMSMQLMGIQCAQRDFTNAIFSSLHSSILPWLTEFFCLTLQGGQRWSSDENNLLKY